MTQFMNSIGIECSELLSHADLVNAIAMATAHPQHRQTQMRCPSRPNSSLNPFGRSSERQSPYGSLPWGNDDEDTKRTATFAEMLAKVQAANKPRCDQVTPDMGPIDPSLTFKSKVFTKLRDVCGNEDITKWFWVNRTYLIELFQSGDYDRGIWHADGAHAYRTVDLNVVITTPAMQITYTEADMDIQLGNGVSSDITTKTIKSGLIPILALIAHLCEPKSVPPHIEPTKPKVTKAVQAAFRSNVTALVSDDDAIAVLDMPVNRLYEAVRIYVGDHMLLRTPDGWDVAVHTSVQPPATRRIRIVCGDQILLIKDFSCTLAECIEIDPSQSQQPEEIAAILSALYIWSQANDICL